MMPDGHAGYAVSPDGDLQNVFRNEGAPPGSGLEAVRYAVEEEGARHARSSARRRSSATMAAASKAIRLRNS